MPRREWLLTISWMGERLVVLTGAFTDEDVVVMVGALVDVRYQVLVRPLSEDVDVFVQRVDDGMVVVAQREGRDLSQFDRPPWARSFRQKIMQRVGEQRE